MTKKEELRKIPKKNYIILLIMFTLAFSIVYYLYKWNEAYSDYQKQIPIIKEVLTEINTDEVEHYVQDSLSTVIYLCTASNNQCRNFEKGFKKLVIQKSLNPYIVYVNLEGIEKEAYTNQFNEKYKKKIGLKNHYPALVVFEEGEIKDVIQGDNEEKLSISDVSKALKKNNIGE